MKSPIRVLVTGAAGQIGYSLLYMIGNGEVFGPDQPIILHCLELSSVLPCLDGVEMELRDCRLHLIKEIIKTDQSEVAFKDIDCAFLVGSVPRKAGMERKDLLSANCKIFKSQGEALDKYAKKSVKVIVVGNPANTNALICSRYAKSIPPENISAMTRLDQNRSVGVIADKLNVDLLAVRNCIVWGNHSATMFPDVSQAKVVSGADGKTITPVYEAINDTNWIRTDFVKKIQGRGSAIIAARKLSSALSAAKAASDHMRDWWNGTQPDEYVSMAVHSDGSYNVDKGLFFSFPCTVNDGKWRIVQGAKFDEWETEMMNKTMNELKEERDMALSSLE